MQKKLTLLMGAPGSGKSTLVTKLQEFDKYVICSADHYFMKTGSYVFDRSKLSDAHKACQFLARSSMETRELNVIIDNTNVKLKDFSVYLKMGLTFGYDISIIEPQTEWRYNVAELTKRNVHGVPPEAISRMVVSIFNTKREVFPVLKELGISCEVK